MNSLEQEVPEGLPLLTFIRQTTPSSYEARAIEKQAKLAAEVHRKAAKLVEANSHRFLQERATWNELRYFRDRPFIEAGRELLRNQAETHREDPYARFFWIQLRLEDATVDVDSSDICALLDDAIPRTYESLDTEQKYTSWQMDGLFPLRFRGTIDRKAPFARSRSVFDVVEQLTRYFELREPNAEQSTYFRPSPVHQFLRGIYAPGKDSYEVMFSWGHHRVHAALAIYEIEFARFEMYGDFRTLTREQYAELGMKLGNDNRAFNLFRAYYDFSGAPDPRAQLRRVQAIVDRHTEDDTLQLVLAVTAFTIGDYAFALKAASGVKVDYGENAWLANAVILTCARALNQDAVAEAAARTLIPLTAMPTGRQWLAKELREVGLDLEAGLTHED